LPHHFIDDDALVRSVRRLMREDERDQVEASLRRWLARQPEKPDLIGATIAAGILGVYPPHITRLKAQGRITPIPIEGSVDVYIRSDIEALAKELSAGRSARAARTAS
jgi:hypothetical protein